MIDISPMANPTSFRLSSGGKPRDGKIPKDWGDELDEVKRKEVRKLLVALEAEKEQDRFREREVVLEKNRQVYRFQEIKKTVLLPTLRELMIDLDHKGHLTKLQEPTPEKVRMDVQVQTQVPKRGAIELSLDKADPTTLKVSYGWVIKEARFHEETFPMDTVTSRFVIDRVLHLLRGLI